MSLMTLDEAIEHCRDRENCSQCGQEHKQLREWLEELKDLRSQYNLPTPHGRLIDADVIMDLLEKSVPEKNRGHQFYVFRHMLRNAPTVIEKEG